MLVCFHPYLSIFVNGDMIIRSTGGDLESEEVLMMGLDIWHFGSHFILDRDNVSAYRLI